MIQLKVCTKTLLEGEIMTLKTMTQGTFDVDVI